MRYTWNDNERSLMSARVDNRRREQQTVVEYGEGVGWIERGVEERDQGVGTGCSDVNVKGQIKEEMKNKNASLTLTSWTKGRRTTCRARCLSGKIKELSQV